MKRVKSSPGRTASGGVSKDAAPSGGGGRLVGAGGRAATADMALMNRLALSSPSTRYRYDVDGGSR